MTTKKKASKSTALVPVEKRAIAALGLTHQEKELVSLAAATAHIVTITNDDGYKQVDSARKALKRTRLEIQKTGDETIEDAKRVVKLADAELTRLVGIIETEEDRLNTLQDARDTEVEKQRQAEIDREVARQAALEERIVELRGNQTLLPTSGSALLAEHISDLQAIPVDESFEEYRERAAAAKAEGLIRLRTLHTAAIAHEAEQKKIEEDRAELARLKAEAAERERKEKIARDAEAARVRAEETAAQAERDRIVAEDQRLAAERAEIEREAAELLKASEPAPLPAPAPTFPAEGVWLLAPTVPAAETAEQEPESMTDRIEVAPPTRDELIAALTSYYDVNDDTVLAWLASHDWREALTELAA